MGLTLLSRDQMMATYGVSQDMLRLYERRALLKPVPIGENRFYTPQDRIRLEIIKKGKRLGFSLAEIEALVFEKSQPAATFSADTVVSGSDPEHVIEELRKLMADRDSIDAKIDELKALLTLK